MISESMFGKISWKMILAELSPLNAAAVTKSRDRSVCVWLRSTREPHAQPVSTTTRMITPRPPFCR